MWRWDSQNVEKAEADASAFHLQSGISDRYKREYFAASGIALQRRRRDGQPREIPADQVEGVVGGQSLDAGVARPM